MTDPTEDVETTGAELDSEVAALNYSTKYGGNAHAYVGFKAGAEWQASEIEKLQTQLKAAEARALEVWFCLGEACSALALVEDTLDFYAAPRTWTSQSGKVGIQYELYDDQQPGEHLGTYGNRAREALLKLRARTGEPQPAIEAFTEARAALEWMCNNAHLILLAEKEEHVDHFFSRAREALKKIQALETGKVK